MPWFKIDDGFWSHAKVLDLSSDALALWVRSGSYCAGHLTDGEVKPSILRLMGASDGAALELVESGLWDFDGGSWWFHDWSVYQPSRESVLAEREAAAERMRQIREAKRKRSLERSGERSGEQPANVRDVFGNSSLSPTRPDPTRPTSTDVEVKSTRGARLSPDWKPSTELAAWAIAKRPDLNVAEQVEAFRDYWKSVAGAKGVKLDWDATFRSWIRNAYASKVPDGSKPTVSGVVTPVECVKHPYYPAHDCAKCVEEAAEEFRRLDASNGREGEAA